MIAWLDSPLTEGVGARTISRRLRKRHIVDFLLGESDVVLEIPDDDAPNLSEGMRKEETELPHEPKEEPDEATNPDEGD